MRLRVIDEAEGFTTVVEVMCVEYNGGESHFKIFDYQDNAAIVKTDSLISAVQGVDRLFERSFADVEGSIEWCEQEDGEET